MNTHMNDDFDVTAKEIYDMAKANHLEFVHPVQWIAYGLGQLSSKRGETMQDWNFVARRFHIDGLLISPQPSTPSEWMSFAFKRAESDFDVLKAKLDEKLNNPELMAKIRREVRDLVENISAQYGIVGDAGSHFKTGNQVTLTQSGVNPHYIAKCPQCGHGGSKWRTRQAHSREDDIIHQQDCENCGYKYKVPRDKK